MIEVVGITKRFAGDALVTAVDDVSFSAGPGEVFGLLGPNGAGKTTALRLLCTLLTLDSGTIRVMGHDVRTQPAQVRAALGLVSNNTKLYGRLTAREMILYFARLHGVERPLARTEALLDEFDIRAYANERCERLSTGMAQKVSIARAMVHDPPVLVLDEPTSGLDIIVAQTFLEFVERSRDAGKCILYSTHIMAEAERLCDRIGILHQGRIFASGTLGELRAATGEHYLESIFLTLVRGRA